MGIIERLIWIRCNSPQKRTCGHHHQGTICCTYHLGKGLDVGVVANLNPCIQGKKVVIIKGISKSMLTQRFDISTQQCI